MLYASNLTLLVPRYSDAEIDGIIRRGTHPTRKWIWEMPSEAFQYLSDPDFSALLAYLRTLKPSGKPLPPPQFSAAVRRDIAAGRFQPAGIKIELFKRSHPVDLGTRYALGRYITTVTCVQCHGPALGGDPQTKAPDLIVAGAYSRAEFERLVTSGVATGNRKLDPAMYYVAIGRLSHLTTRERDALYSYLIARAAKRF